MVRQTEYKLQTTHLDVAAVMQECRAFPSCPTPPDQTGAAGFTVTRLLKVVGRCAHRHHHRILLVILMGYFLFFHFALGLFSFPFSFPDDVPDGFNEGRGSGGWGYNLIRKVTRVEDIVRRRTMLTVVD